jgi:hypothetical protein
MFGHEPIILSLIGLIIIILLIILPIISAVSLKEYAVYEKARLRKVVKIGFSWPAFFFNWIWAFVKQLWLIGIIYLAILVIAATSIIVFIAERKPEIDIIMGVIELIGSLIFGFSGNSWIESSLNNQGFRFVGKVTAKSVDQAHNLAAHTIAEQKPEGAEQYESSPFPEPGLPEELASHKWSIYGCSGPLAGAAVDLTIDPIVIGRDPKEANLIITSNPGISRRHCIITMDNDKQNIILEDCGSKNGTFLESGTRLEPGKTYLLQGDDRFYLINPGILFEVRNR